MSALRQALLSEEKHYNCCDDDTPYLMDHPSQSCPHSLEHTVEKCLTYIGGIFLSKDVCKQQPSRTILIKPKCQKPCNWYRMSVVRGTKRRFSRCYISEIPQGLNFIHCMALKTGVTLHSMFNILPHFWTDFPLEDYTVLSCPVLQSLLLWGFY